MVQASRFFIKPDYYGLRNASVSIINLLPGTDKTRDARPFKGSCASRANAKDL